MRIFVLNPSFGENFVRVARWAAKSRGRVQRHPDYLLIAVQILLNDGHDVYFCEAAAQNLSPEESLQKAKEFKPDLLVIHATTPSIYSDIDQAKHIKEQTCCKVAFVGQHVSAETGNTFEIGRQTVDFILRGEYDDTLRDLAKGLKASEIKGLSWIKDGKISHNENRPLLNVNELPFPAWHLIKPEWYPDAGKKFPFLTLLSGRGCNNACTFCRDPQIMYGHALRMRDARLVADEMEYDLKIYPQIREIMFETDTFAADSNHVIDVCHEILKRNLHKRISWSCNMRVDIELDLFPLMKKAGCRMLMTGFEFGTDKALKSVCKGRVNTEMAREFAQKAADVGLIVHGCFMIGAPGETKEDARATIELAKSIPMDTVQFTGVAAYPGTVLYRQAKENGWLIPGDWTEWLTKEKEQRTLLNYPLLSQIEIDKFIDIGLKEFYLRPKQILKMLFAIRSFGDILRKIYGLFAFIDYFFKKIFSKKQITKESC
ncbi:MAG: radical SAM protein [Candidatus Omnitrophota bacterium]